MEELIRTVAEYGLMRLPNVAVVTSAALAGVAAITYLIANFVLGRRPPPAEPSVTAGRREETRIVEARTELARQEWSNCWNRWVSGALTAGQYLIGAALASAFLQEAISEYSVGGLGLVVLFAQVVQQRFRPDLRAIGAKERATLLRRIVRDAEDQLYAAETKREGAPSLYDIRTMVSRGLAEVERLETEELTLRIRAQLETAEATPNKALERAGEQR